MSWALGIPILGDIVKKVIEFVSKRWGYNKTQQEIEQLVQEVIAEANLLETVRKLYDTIMAYEGGTPELAQFGWAGKVVLLARCTWRPALQWGMTAKVMYGLFLEGQSIEQMKSSIAFIGGLAVLREFGKRISNGKTK